MKVWRLVPPNPHTKQGQHHDSHLQSKSRKGAHDSHMFAELPHHPQRDDTPPYLPSPDTCSNTANCGGDQQRRKTEETHRRSARVHRSRRQRIQQYSLPRRRVFRDCAFETRTAKKAKCPSDYKEKKACMYTFDCFFFFLRKGNEERRGVFFLVIVVVA